MEKLSKRLFFFIDFILVSVTTFAFTPRNFNNEIQLGLSNVGSYGRPLFANAVYNEPRGWQNNSNQSITDMTLFDANGFPLRLTTAVPKMVIQPGQNGSDNQYAYAGKICVTWEGNADIRVVPGNGGSFISSGSSAQTGLVLNGVRYYDNGSLPNGLRIEILGIDEANPPKNIKAWMNDLRNPSKTLRPSEQAGVEHFIHPVFADRFLISDDFSVLRTMDLLLTADSRIVSWSDRRKPAYCFQSGTLGNHRVGVSYETIIRMCNQYNKDLWLNIPTFADENFVVNLAKLVQGKDPDGIGSPGLNSDLRCFVEHSNELGWTFFATECNTAGAALSPAINGREYAARLKAKATSVFKSALDADKKDQFKFVHCIQTADFGSSDKEMQQVMPAGSYGATLVPDGKPDYIGITTYFGSKIEQEVFNSYNYMDASQRSSELSRAFVDLEKRMLIGSASTTGVDYTGGGISDAAKKLRVKYNLPLLVYEGGCGFNLASSQYVSKATCQIAPKVTPVPATYYPFNVFLNTYADSCHVNGKVNFTNFIRDLHKHPDMAKIFEINSVLCKMDTVEMMTQFGDSFDPKGNIDYGYWGCMASLSQPINEAYRYQFWKNWYSEHKNIREVGQAINSGGAPRFLTNSIESVVKNMPFVREILIDGGDGNLQAKMINRPDILPNGLNFSFDAQNKKIILSGTISETGSFKFLYQILDADLDPAYKIFSISCINNPQDSVYAYDDFGSPATDNLALNGLAAGYGFNAPWRVANASYSTDVNTHFYQRSINQLVYPMPHTLPSLKCSGGGKAESFPDGGTTNYFAQRNIDVSRFDYLIDAEDVSYIGKKGTSLWCSLLYHRPNVNNSTASVNADIIRFNSNMGGYTFRKNAEVILVAGVDGKYRLDCHPLSMVTDDAALFTQIPTNITATNAATQFLVFEFKFGNTTDTVRFYHNPTQFGVEKPNVLPAATYITPENEKIRIAKFIFVGNKTTGKSNESIDDLRFGDTYTAVSPIEPLPDTDAPSIPANFQCTELDNGNVTLSWQISTDNVGVVGYQVFYNDNKIATVSGLSKSMTQLFNGVHSFYVRAIDQAGNLSLPTNIITKSNLTTLHTYPIFEGVKVFPNPANDKFSVSLNNNFEKIDVEVFSATGSLLLKKTGVAHNQYIDISSVPNGLLFVFLSSEGERKCFKMLKR